MIRPPRLTVRGVPVEIAVLRVSRVKCVLLAPPEVVIKASPVDAMEVQVALVAKQEVLPPVINQLVARKVGLAASSASAVVRALNKSCSS